jgi:RNA polymerase sigma-70 factor (ECF subfamily)
VLDEAALTEALARARAGDRGAMGDLYRAFSGSLFSYLLTQVRRREDAEDLVGQAFLDAMAAVARFEGDLSGFRAWIFRIGRNRAVDLARRRRRKPEIPFEGVEEAMEVADPEGEAIGRAERERLWRAVRDLPDAQREVITLRLAGGLTAAEIGRVVGKRAGAVKSLQHRALENLARALGARTQGVWKDA